MTMNLLTTYPAQLPQKSGNQTTSQNFGEAAIKYQVEEGSFKLLEDLKLNEKVVSSFLLGLENGTRTLDWSYHDDIKGFVKDIVQERLVLSELQTHVKVMTELKRSITASISRSTKGYYPDLGIIQNSALSYVGVVQVKCPKQNAMNQLNQIVNYLECLYSQHGARFSFGIYTTNDEWRFLWLEVSDAAARCTCTRDYLDDLVLAKSPVLQDSEERKVYATKVFKFNDPELIKTICSVLWKMAKASVVLPQSYVDPPRMYPFVSQQKFEFKYLPKKIRFNNSMPSKVKEVYVLHYYHRGGDGRVSLAVTPTGELCVLNVLDISEFTDGFGDFDDTIEKYLKYPKLVEKLAMEKMKDKGLSMKI